ncbi:Oxidoreductase, Gfo/Idh/MocA family [Roseibacterium elongatum DSM 19469]|uniref:Oxidoreductase, Gfo/Idh/MocA family n=1 Tax=Roseicyclus elongatus DSM 19469 TaxID=1294273 RepID=W8S1Z1_9RHOB|nr:Gfo/Idh/MocA family oxidoreductase [Roseibacterium elongatum]AHM04207.1 Oxidoreductase, Gfo/Idh/MocA family [Roseibacterium elongatum DSM 19469]
MQDGLRWGVLGAAAFARKTMAPAIHRAERAQFSALATRDRGKAAAFQAFAPGLRLHDSYDDLLTDPEIDAIYIPLPNAMHAEWCERAVRAGKAVLCEKPIALSLAEIDDLIAVRDTTGRFLAEAWMPAHHPQWDRVAQILSDGGIGRLHSVTGVFAFPLRDPANVRNSADLGGGALRDVGVYPIGTFRRATGLEPEVTAAEAVLEQGVDASTWVQARAGDVRFSFYVSMRADLRQEMVFHGSDGSIVVEAPFNPGSYGEAALHWRRAGQDELRIRFPAVDQYKLQVEAVSASLLDGAPFACPLEFSRGTQAVIDAVLRAI